jgi:multisubunit Na+/H+ antiporter MnhB subunit
MKEFNIAPLSSGYMITSIVGFLISVFYVVPTAPSWGFTFVVFFTLMFIAAMVSMTYAPTDWQLKPFRKNVK